MKKIDLMNNTSCIAICAATIGFGSIAFAADTASKDEAAKPSAIEKLVANQATAAAAASSDPTADKPMTINFSDFVKDGAGCGVPNLDTSSK